MVRYESQKVNHVKR